MKEKIFYSQKIQGQYLKYYIHSYDSVDKQPLLIYIHGAGSRGNQLNQMGRVGVLAELDKGRDIPACIVAPQCHSDTWFDLFMVLSEFIEYFINNKKIDKNRVYLMGVSMGAYASWQMAMSHPEWFAALVAVCGGGMYWNAERIKNLPIWAFHGALDTTVLPYESINMIKAVNSNGGKAKLTIYPDKTHNAWDSAFSDEMMWKWLFEQRKSTTEIVPKSNIITGD